MATKTAKKVVEEKTITKKTTSKKAPRKTVVDTTAIELPVEEVKEEPEIEIETVNLDEEAYNMVARRFRYAPLSDAERDIAATLFQNTKNFLCDSYSESNARSIALAATDAAFKAMEKVAILKSRAADLEKKASAREEKHNKWKEERAKAKDQRHQNKLERKEAKAKNREERKNRLYTH